MYHAAARNAQQANQWKSALQDEAATQFAAGRLLVVAQVGGPFDARYKWGPEWQFGINSEFRFKESEAAEADAQWDRAMALMQGNGATVTDAFAERWDQDLENADAGASQERLNYQTVAL
jgi:hypothetical protein